MNVSRSTLKHGLCIGCGICDLSCPEEAIRIRSGRYGENIPVIDPQKCTNCSECVRYCPNTWEKMLGEAEKINGCGDPMSYGIAGLDGYVSYVKSSAERRKSASGGFTTEFLRQHLDEKRVNGVIHAESLLNPAGSPHYAASFSRSLSEIRKKRSSHYVPVCFSGIIKKHIRGKRGRYIFIGTPCVIRGYREFFSSHKDYTGHEFLFVALCCSHIVNNQFMDFLSDHLKIPGGKDFICNLRNKDHIIDANTYNTHFYDNEGDLVKTDRFGSGFTRFWRNHYFSMNVCHYCSDFWGYHGDVSVKDAWGKRAIDPLGANIVVFRDRGLRDLTEKNGNLVLKIIPREELLSSQMDTVRYKQADSLRRILGYKFSPSNLRSGFLRNWILSRSTKCLYQKTGYRITYLVSRFMEGVLNTVFYGRISLKALIILILRIFKKLIRLVLFPVRAVRNKIGYYRNAVHSKKEKKILVVGGYGYANAGDEAQLSETLKVLKSGFPDHLVRVLTPNEVFTHRYHPGVNTGRAPRVMFFDEGSSDLYSLSSTLKKIRFLLRISLIIMNAHLLRARLPSIFVNPKRIALLDEIRTSACVYFSGGGYLTGKTRSRLWDGMALIRAASVFNVPVFLSGQSIGVWESAIDRKIGKWGLKKAKLITVRDAGHSIGDLKKIGLTGETIFTTHDDALFCEKINSRKLIEKKLKQAGLTDEEISTGYVTVQFHFWDFREYRSKIRLMDIVREVIDEVTAFMKKKVVLISMTPLDEEALDLFCERFSIETYYRLRADYDFRLIRGVIAASDLCITMKHHPIIFAVGEKTPVMSLSFGSYYEHKNLGALKLFQLEDLNIRLDQDRYLTDVRRFLKSLKAGREMYENIEPVFEKIRKDKEKFIGLMKQIVR